MSRIIRFGYTPDPDDAFHYHALECGALQPPPGCAFTFAHRPIQQLNESCLRQEFDVCAISSAFYPEIDSDYVILASGASVGRGYGPVLGCHAERPLTTLTGRRVGIPGTTTTGYFLLRYFYADFVPVVMPFDEVAGAILRGEVDAGVLIHEELLNYAEQPIAKICCLGARWFELTGLPLPVGLNVARRALGHDLIENLETLLHASMRQALAEPAPALRFASDFGRGAQSLVREEFVARFANSDTLLMPGDVRMGLQELYVRAHARGLIDHHPRLDLVEPQAA